MYTILKQVRNLIPARVLQEFLEKTNILLLRLRRGCPSKGK